MPRVEIPTEWDLGADPRYKRQNMERAMKGKIERGLVELITNSDDVYQDLEDSLEQISGKIRIEIERRRKGQSSIVRVRDRAGGMNREEMFYKLGALGRRTSGFEKGKPRRGLHGRGARDVACFGPVHFESIKNGEYNHLIIPPSLRCHFSGPQPKKATADIREKLGIPRGNGTVVTIEVNNRFRIPQHETLLESFSRYYSLRDLFSSSNREIVLVDLRTDREDRLTYTYPQGEVVFDDEIVIADYPGVKAKLLIREHSTPFQQDMSPCREGILIKSAASIHDCTYFGLESDPFSWRFTGEVRCQFIDTLVREYDDRDEANPDCPNHPANNPQRLLDPLRDGLIAEHPFARALQEECKRILRDLIASLRNAEAPPKRSVISENLNKKLDSLSKEISKVLERKLKDIEEELLPGSELAGSIEKLAIGLHIIPPGEELIIVNEPKIFSVKVKHYEALDESLPISVESSDADIKVRASPVYLRRFSENRTVGATTFTIESSEVGAEAFVEVRYDGYDNLVLARVVESPPPPTLPEGLTFDKPLYRLGVNKEKTLILWLKTTELRNPTIAEITSDHSEIVIKGGAKCELRKADTQGVLMGKCRIVGRQLKAKGNITARIEGFSPAQTRVVIEEREKSGVRLKIEPVEDSFGSVRYKWDDKNPYVLKIGAKHPSIRRYLGEPTEQGYQGSESPLYHTVLAEVVAEALAFNVLEKQFKSEGQQEMLDYTSVDTYYHKHFSDFLVVAHKNLVTEYS